MRHSRLWAFALVGCALCGCSHGQGGRSFSGSWDDGKAREIAIAVASTWKFPGEIDFQGAAAAQLQRDAYAILPFDAGGAKRRLVLVAVAPRDHTCHACAPVTGGVVFSNKNGRWEAGYDQAMIVSLGAFGKPPKARLQALGPALPAVAFEMDAMAQGYEAATLTLVGEVAGGLKELLSIETEASNEASADAMARRNCPQKSSSHCRLKPVFHESENLDPPNPLPTGGFRLDSERMYEPVAFCTCGKRSPRAIASVARAWSTRQPASRSVKFCR